MSDYLPHEGGTGAYASPPLPMLPPARVRTRSLPTATLLAPPPQCDAAGPAPAHKPAYEVGYGKPPKHTQFKAGRSGNPKGRPRKAKGMNTIARETLTEKITVRTATGTKKITRIEAVLHKTVEQALKGNPRALAELLKLYGSAIPNDPTPSDASLEREEDLTAADLAALDELRAELLREQEASHDAQ